MSQDDHDQKKENADEAKHAEHRKPDLAALISHLNIERHLVRARRVWVFEPQDEQRDENQQIAGGGAEGVEVSQNVDRRGFARRPWRKEGKHRLKKRHQAKGDDRARRGPEAAVHLRKPGR